MQIGANIRGYRKAKNMTQAQLARALGVSAQTVSKWETDAGLPDTAQLIPLARALGISTDMLLMNTNRQQEFQRRWESCLRHYGDEPQKQLEVCTEVLAEDPDNTAFLFRASCANQRLAEDSEDEGIRHIHLHNALKHAEKALRLDPNDEVYKEHLAQLYSDLGLDDQALKMAYQCQNSSRVLLWVLKGEALKRHQQTRIDSLFLSLLNEIDHAGMPEVVEALIQTAIPDGNYQHYTSFLFTHGWHRARSYADQGNHDAVMEELHRLLNLAMYWDSTKSNPRFTAPLFDLLEGSQNPPGVPTFVEQFIHEVEFLFPQLAEREDYQTLLATAYTKQQKGDG